MFRKSKISKNNVRKKRLTNITKPKDAKTFVRHFWSNPCRRRGRDSQKGAGCPDRNDSSKAAGPCPCECDWSVLRLFSTLGKESTVFEARTRRCSGEGLRLGN